MIKIPREISDKAFKEKLRPGAVLKCRDFEFSDGSKRDKYLVFITFGEKEDIVYFFMTTTNVERYNDKPWLKPHVIIIPKNTVPYLSDETVVQCDTLRDDVTAEKLKRRYSEGKVEIYDRLPPPVIADLENTVRNSKFLSSAEKTIVLGAL
jgi:hypothetical protein